MIGNTTITVVRRARVADRYGDQQPDLTSPPATHEVRGCTVAPRSSTDIVAGGRQGVLIGLSVLAPSSADVAVGDQVEVDGELYNIEGAIGRWTSPYSKIAGLEFALTRAVG